MLRYSNTGEKYLTFKLYYTPETPEDYEPVSTSLLLPDPYL